MGVYRMGCAVLVPTARKGKRHGELRSARSSIFFDPLFHLRPESFGGECKGGDAICPGDVNADGLTLEIHEDAAHVGGSEWDIVLEDVVKPICAKRDATIGVIIITQIGLNVCAAGDAHEAFGFLSFAAVKNLDFITR
jgi:hypothetical protein